MTACQGVCRISVSVQLRCRRTPRSTSFAGGMNVFAWSSLPSLRTSAWAKPAVRLWSSASVCEILRTLLRLSSAGDLTPVAGASRREGCRTVGFLATARPRPEPERRPSDARAPLQGTRIPGPPVQARVPLAPTGGRVPGNPREDPRSRRRRRRELPRGGTRTARVR